MKLRIECRLARVVLLSLFVYGLGWAQNQLPRPTVLGIVNGANFEAGQPLAPGALVALFGANYGLELVGGETVPMSFLSTTVPLATSLGGYSVTFRNLDTANSVAAPLFAVVGRAEGEGRNRTFPGQINAQVPWEVGQGPVEVVVRRTQQGSVLASDGFNVQVAATSPGIFAVDRPGLFPSDRGFGIVINNSDGQLAWPVGTLRGSHPARIGDFIQIWCTGLGAIDPRDPPPVTGDDSLDNQGNFVRRDTAERPTVLIGGREARVTFSGLQPQFVTVYQINAQVPDGVEPGDAVPVQVRIGDRFSQQGVVMAVTRAAAALQ